MANIEFKVGEYNIPALSSNRFTFWWSDDEHADVYFDVTVAQWRDRHPG